MRLSFDMQNRYTHAHEATEQKPFKQQINEISNKWKWIASTNNWKLKIFDFSSLHQRFTWIIDLWKVFESDRVCARTRIQERKRLKERSIVKLFELTWFRDCIMFMLTGHSIACDRSISLCVWPRLQSFGGWLIYGLIWLLMKLKWAKMKANHNSGGGVT